MEDPIGSNLNVWAVIFLVVMGGLVLRANRNVAALALLITALVIPLGQQLVVADLHFRFARMLILLGGLRVWARGEARNLRFNRLDKLFTLWVLVTLACGILRGPKGETFGMAYDAFGAYFLFRAWLGDLQGLFTHLRALSYVVIVLAVFMSVELVIHRNLFSVLGGVPEFTVIREGRFRCQGPFRHPILAGTFAAAVFPLIVGLWFQGKRDRFCAFLGSGSAIFCSYAAASSGALLTLLGAFIGIGLWPLRYRMHLIRRGIVVGILIGALFMTAPVWYLISRISEITGGTGWHRSHLIDQAIEHFNEWGLIGTSYTAHWAADPTTILAVDPNNMDITNHYVAQGTNGGAVGLALFIAILVNCYRVAGRTVRVSDPSVMSGTMAWALGVCMLGNCVAFISVSYFDQIQIFWFWLLAVMSTLSVKLAQHVRQRSVGPQTGELSANVQGSASY